MINKSTGGGEQESIAWQIEYVTKKSKSEPLRLADHPFYGSSITTPIGDVIVGRRLWTGKLWSGDSIVEYVDVISLSRDGLATVRQIDGNAVPLSIQVALASYPVDRAELVRNLPYMSVTMYLDGLGNISAILPMQSMCALAPEAVLSFDAKMLEWGVELLRGGSGDGFQTSARVAEDWTSRMAQSLLDLS